MLLSWNTSLTPSIHQFKFTIYANKTAHSERQCCYMCSVCACIYFQLQLMHCISKLICSILPRFFVPAPHFVFSFASSSLPICVQLLCEMSSEQRCEIMHGAAFEKCVPHVPAPFWMCKNGSVFVQLMIISIPMKLWKRIRLSAFMRILYEQNVDSHNKEFRRKKKNK